MQNDDTTHTHRFGAEEPRPVMQSVIRGARGRCPACDKGALFDGFVKTVDVCENCGEEIHHHRSDDLPPYLVIFVVGHIMVGGWMMTELLWTLTSWQHLAIWAPMTIIMSLVLMRPAKGAVVGLQWALRMHGFGGVDDEIHATPAADRQP